MKTKILDLIDFEKVNTLLEGFNKSTGFVTAILDLEGNVLSQSGWRPICTDFHRVHPETAKKCVISDTVLANKMAEGEKYHFYQCLNGLVDVAVPIIIKGEHIANLFSGQFFFEEPDNSFFQKQATKYGFNQEIYLESLKKVPVFSKEKVKVAMDFLLNMTLLISEMTLQKLEQTILNKSIVESEERFREIFESANVGKSITLITGEISVNQAFCDMLGYSKEELQNKKWQDITPLDEIEAIQQKLEPLLKGTAKAVRLEKGYLHKNGTHIWADVSVVMQYDAVQNPRYFITTIIDITERKQAEEALLESEKKYRLLFEDNPYPMWVYDLETLNFLEVNEVAILKYGFSRTEFLKMNLYDIRPVEDVEKLIKNVRQKSDEYSFSGEWTHKNKKGKTFTVEIISHNIDYNDKKARLVIANDITERKLAEINLEESEKRYRKLFENLTTGFVLYEVVQNDEGIPIDLIILAANEKFEITTGLKTQDVIGKHLTQALPGIKNDAINWIGTFGKVALNGEPQQFEQGSELLGIYYAIAAYQLGSNQCAVIFDDITERKLSEKSLIESEKRFKSIFELASLGMAQVDINNGKILTVNKYYEIITGFSREELFSMSFIELTHPEDRAKDWDIFTRAAKGEIEYRNEKRYIKKDGSVIWVRLHVAFIRDDIGNPIKTIAICEQISDQKLAQEKIRLSEERYRNILQVAPVGIAIHHKDKIVFINPAGLEIFGAKTTDQLIGKKIKSFIHPEKRKKFINRIQRLLKGEQGLYPVEDRYIRLDGSVIDVEAIATLVTYNDEPAVQVIITDITERKRTREQLLQFNAELELKVKERTAQLEASNNELEAFSYSVSHDLRAPLRHINGYVNLLNERFRDELPEKAQHYLATVTDASRQMGTLIDDLLQFSRNSRQELHQTTIEMNHIVKEVLETIKPDINDRNIKWSVQELPQIYGDYALLKQVWVNLLDNAIKYTRNKKSAEITIGFIEENKNFVFFVRDNGVGFNMKYAHKLFGVFQRLHSQAEFEGTGIGLANIQRIINKHNGQVWAKAELDKGATFFFSLPKNI